MSNLPVTDRNIENVVSVVLRTGVLIAGLIVLCGGIYFVARHGQEHVNYRVFNGGAASGYRPGEIVRGVLHMQGRSIIQLGILCLIATPIARVIVSLVGFALERDRTYVLVTALVLAILVYSLVFGAQGAA
jgi:uncharacterized membrane protein